MTKQAITNKVTTQGNTNQDKRSPGKFYIGLMSGTSADGIDLALVEFIDGQQPRLVASHYQAYDNILAQKITALYQPEFNEIDRAFHLDIELAQQFSQAISALLAQENLASQDIIAIGNHGQTIRHRPHDAYPFTLQIGCSQTLATLTGIRVVGQFRRKDMALGGQGAPLVPIFHQQLFKPNTDKSINKSEVATFVVNIGGIANVTFLPTTTSNQSVLGFDTGPGNALLDDWFTQNNSDSEFSYDKSGDWAASGCLDSDLLAQFLQDDYIQAIAPKSTGREYFNQKWLQQQLVLFKDKFNNLPSPVDIQATLLAFTVQSISQNIMALITKDTVYKQCENSYLSNISANIYLCGGGVHNSALVHLLHETLGPAYNIKSTDSLNINGDILEAMAFAWFAYAFDHGLVSNIPAVTGASASCTLGNEFLP